MTSGPKAAKFKDSDHLLKLLNVCISLLKLLEKENLMKPMIALMSERGAASPGNL